MSLGIALALACAAVTQLGFLCKHRGATARRTSSSTARCAARARCSPPWFAIGMAIAAVAWVLHVAALALAPLSMVQAVLSTGVVMLAVLGDRAVRLPASARRQWAGVGHDRRRPRAARRHAPGAPSGHARRSPSPALIAFEAGMLALGVLLIAAPKLGAPAHHHGARARRRRRHAVRRLRRRPEGAHRRRRAARSRSLASPWLPVARRWPPCSPSSPPPAASRRATPSRSSPAPRPRPTSPYHRRHRRLRRRARRRRPARRPDRRLRAGRRRRARHPGGHGAPLAGAPPDALRVTAAGRPMAPRAAARQAGRGRRRASSAASSRRSRRARRDRRADRRPHPRGHPGLPPRCRGDARAGGARQRRPRAGALRELRDPTPRSSSAPPPSAASAPSRA